MTDNKLEDRLLGIESRLEEIKDKQDVTTKFAETRILIRRLEKLLIKIDDKISKQISR